MSLLKIHIPLVIVLVFLFTVAIIPCIVSASTIHVPANYSTIQAAVTAALPGDTIAVNSGLYRENVMIFTNNITLTGVNTGSGMPVVDGGAHGTIAIYIAGNNVTVQGFNVTNSTQGIGAFSEDILIYGNIANNNSYAGIYLWSTTSNDTVKANIANNNNQYGIFSGRGSGNKIIGNTANNNTYDGIYLGSNSPGDGVRNNVTGNTALYNMGNGIELYGNTYSIVSGNTIKYNAWNGIVLGLGNNNTITNNTAVYNNAGIIFGNWYDNCD